MHFHASEFGQLVPPAVPGHSAEMMSGVLVTDNWWVNGAQPLVVGCTLVEADPASKKLPSPPDAVAAVIAKCGKVRRTVQAPLFSMTSEAAAGLVPGVRMPSGTMIASAKPGGRRARFTRSSRTIARGWRDRRARRTATSTADGGRRGVS